MIKGLIKKDLYNLGSYKSSLIIMVIFCGIAIIGTKAVNYGPIIISTMIGMIALSTFSYDEISKANKYILTLPTNRKELVKEKIHFSYWSDNIWRNIRNINNNNNNKNNELYTTNECYKFRL